MLCVGLAPEGLDLFPHKAGVLTSLVSRVRRRRPAPRPVRVGGTLESTAITTLGRWTIMSGRRRPSPVPVVGCSTKSTVDHAGDLDNPAELELPSGRALGRRRAVTRLVVPDRSACWPSRIAHLLLDGAVALARRTSSSFSSLPTPSSACWTGFTSPRWQSAASPGRSGRTRGNVTGGPRQC